MTEFDSALVLDSLQALLAELFHGPAETECWILDGGTRMDLFGTLDGLDARQASARPVPGHASVAGHANHLRFSLELLNRWSRGENPFLDVDWQSSWSVQSVTDEEWRQLLAALRAEADAWQAALPRPREWDRIELTGAMASAAHVAYHLGVV
ncbi:MAG: DinB family protein, partial [Planctomycetota bacterium]